jgi:hypothetical protein
MYIKYPATEMYTCISKGLKLFSKARLEPAILSFRASGHPTPILSIKTGTRFKIPSFLGPMMCRRMFWTARHLPFHVVGADQRSWAGLSEFY